MPDQQFLRYVGPPILHDASIVAVRSIESRVEVELLSHDGWKFIVRFDHAQVLSSVSSEGMLVYSLSELRSDSPFRRFAFANSEESTSAKLEVEAQDFQVLQLGS